MKDYTINFPDNYHRQPLPGKNTWVAALRSGEYKQADGYLMLDDEEDGKYCYCCLGVLSKLQGRLNEYGYDVDDNEEDGQNTSLAESNPLYDKLLDVGRFPLGINILIQGKEKPFDNLADCNDSGLNFTQIADIIDKVWYDETEEKP